MKSPLRGTKVMLLGGTNVGKTHSLRTLVDAGLKPLCIFTDPGYSVLGELLKEKISWRYIPTAIGVSEMLQKVKAIGTKTQKELCADVDKERYSDASPLGQIIQCLENFVDQNGRSWGHIETWGTGIVLVTDGLTGFNKAAWRNVAGKRVFLDKPDYSLAQVEVGEYMDMLNVTYRCHSVIIAHPEKEMDAVKGGMRLYPTLPGQKLAPVFGANFDEIILCEREPVPGKNEMRFTWNNMEVSAEVKKRYLPFGANQAPSFVPLIEAWKRQGGIIEGDEK